MVDKHGVIVFDDNIHAGVSPEIKKQYFTRYILIAPIHSSCEGSSWINNIAFAFNWCEWVLLGVMNCCFCSSAARTGPFVDVAFASFLFHMFQLLLD